LVKKLALAIVIATFAVLLMFDRPAYTSKTQTDLELISHAGAGTAHGPYANSLESLERGYSDGHRIFEVDVHLTTDGYPVLMHDWNTGFAWWFTRDGDTVDVPTKSEFDALVMNHGHTQMDLDDLASWMVGKPDVIVELNIKAEVPRILTEFADRYPLLLNRIIAEVYDPSKYADVRALGYDNILWVADDFTHDQILEIEASHDFYAIALRYDSERIEIAQSIQTPVWAYTLNTDRLAIPLSDMGVDGIYTDYLIR
jgi:glycerophosphoryl diester phosphodiesterase